MTTMLKTKLCKYQQFKTDTLRPQYNDLIILYCKNGKKEKCEKSFKKDTDTD